MLQEWSSLQSSVPSLWERRSPELGNGPTRILSFWQLLLQSGFCLKRQQIPPAVPKWRHFVNVHTEPTDPFYSSHRAWPFLSCRKTHLVWEVTKITSGTELFRKTPQIHHKRTLTCQQLWLISLGIWPGISVSRAGTWSSQSWKPLTCFSARQVPLFAVPAGGDRWQAEQGLVTLGSVPCLSWGLSQHQHSLSKHKQPQLR